MAYSQVRGRRPFERASKIAHTEILSNSDVQEFVANCSLPAPLDGGRLTGKLLGLPEGDGRITTVIAVDGGMTEAAVRREFPSAAITFMTFGPLLLSLADLADVDRQPFIGPDDMAKLKRLQRYNLVVPTKGVRAPGAKSFAEGVRVTIHRFFKEKYPELLGALQWLLFREWLPDAERQEWNIPQCPNSSCSARNFVFRSGGPVEQACPVCGLAIYLSDGLRLYERIDEDQGAGAVMAYLLTALEQIVLLRIIRAVWEMKPATLREILLVKDGPLAFFGVTAPLHQPMRELMAFLARQDDGAPLLNLVGLEKSGPFVEHAALIEPLMPSATVLVLDNDYIYRYIQPGDPAEQTFGRNTYYGAKVILRTPGGDTYVASVPTAKYIKSPKFEDLFNAAEVLRVTGKLHCSMYDNALLPIVLANRLVSLADVPSSEILAKFAAKGVVKVTSLDAKERMRR